ncbi:hypothetical protein [Acinetobacter sp. WCHAc060025]|uniref:hypothetical protein n=1 Tax=Acinetobacter sp. WCHAc060025 TaxID=2518625 RepID=UPI0010230F52|nr:hypothetical protein [Acinetobacter sp. WCHAc060025]RZG77456.1 hypothetical protein EXE09_03365 [Acinetobacter sp. WCHAc060025]
MDAQKQRLNALSAVLATTLSKPTKTEAVWVTASNDGYKVAFDSNSGTETAVFSLTKEQVTGLVQDVLGLDYNLLE